jgi:hypothetical protein
LYRRIFPNLRIHIYVTIGFLGAMSLAFIFAAVFQCNPIAKLWSPENQQKLSCFPPLAFWCDVSAVYVATDLWIMALPARTIFGMCGCGLLCGLRLTVVRAVKASSSHGRRRFSSWGCSVWGSCKSPARLCLAGGGMH